MVISRSLTSIQMQFLKAVAIILLIQNKLQILGRDKGVDKFENKLLKGDRNNQ